MPPKKSAVARWYDKVASFNVESLFSRRRQPGPRRIVCVNQPLPSGYLDAAAKGRVKADHRYVSNQVTTSKYTLITFLPRNFIEQFRRVANVFFLAIAVLQFFHKFSTISPGLIIFALLVVLGFTACKDTKHHQSDCTINQSSVLLLDMPNSNPMQAKSRTFVRGVRNLVRRRPRDEKDVEQDDDGWKPAAWEDVRVGDIVKIRDNELLPAHILVRSPSEDDNLAFMGTKNLDGETNLKSRHAAASLTHLTTASAFADASFHVDAEPPAIGARSSAR